jgi:hypothetical protein
MISGGNKLLPVNCQSSKRDGSEDYPGSDTDENLMQGIMSKLDSIGSVQQSIHDLVVSSQTSARIEHQEQSNRFAQSLKDMRREILGNVAAELEIIDDRANKSSQKLSQEHSQLLLRFFRKIEEEFQNLEKNQYNSSTQQLQSIRDEITSRFQNQTHYMERTSQSKQTRASVDYWMVRSSCWMLQVILAEWYGELAAPPVR